MTKLKCQIKPKTLKFKVLSVKGLLKNSDAYYLYPTCSLVQHAAFRFRTLWAYGFDSAAQGSFGFENIKGQEFSMNFQHILDFKVRKKFILQS